MSDIAISVENLSKSYVLGHNAAQAEGYTALRDVLVRNVRNLARKTRDMFSGRAIVQGDEVEEFWALKDVSFEIRQGDRVGIIGRNGAGKSTLLKVLSRITEPTTGRIKITGRVASLLEVGTGFHPELTGRENVFLNGAILGMSRRDIQRKFDEIVAFAEVEKFLDTPVKRYSSGMYVRLAFAVAAHLEPETLIVDEVLAVGDAAFQKKCLGKMDEISKEGRTVLFVSHNMAAISNLCAKVIYLSSGKLKSIGDSEKIINEYLQDSIVTSKFKLLDRKDREGSGAALFESVEIVNSNSISISNIRCGEDVEIKLTILSKIENRTLKNLELAIGFDDSRGSRVCHIGNESTGQSIVAMKSGSEMVVIKIPKLQLMPDIYRLTLFLKENGDIVDWIKDAFSFIVEPGDYYQSGKLPPSNQGYFLANYAVILEEKDAYKC